MDWNAELVDQLEWHWQQQLRPRLDGLTDDARGSTMYAASAPQGSPCHKPTSRQRSERAAPSARTPAPADVRACDQPSSRQRQKG
jgi:hypothetical protein